MYGATMRMTTILHFGYRLNVTETNENAAAFPDRLVWLSGGWGQYSNSSFWSSSRFHNDSSHDTNIIKKYILKFESIVAARELTETGSIYQADGFNVRPFARPSIFGTRNLFRLPVAFPYSKTDRLFRCLVNTHSRFFNHQRLCRQRPTWGDVTMLYLYAH